MSLTHSDLLNEGHGPQIFQNFLVGLQVDRDKEFLFKLTLKIELNI